MLKGISIRIVPRGKAKTLLQASVSEEVRKSLNNWKKAVPSSSYVLIDGLALAFYAQPRYTEDVDVLVLSENDIPNNVDGFKHHRLHAFEDKTTGVEVEIITPSLSGIPVKVVQKIIDTSVIHDGIQCASAIALIVLKLYALTNNPKREWKDKNDILSILDADSTITENNLQGWSLSKEQLAHFVDVVNMSKFQ